MSVAETAHVILFRPLTIRGGGVVMSTGSDRDVCSADIVIEYDGEISKDRYGDAAAVIAKIADKAYDDSINTRVGECMAVINAAHEDKIKELEIRTERAERVRAQQGNEIIRLEGKL